MKVYIDKYNVLLTRKQFEEQYFDKKIVLEALLHGYFQYRFIKVCNACSELCTIEEALNIFIEQLQEDERLFSEYCDYLNIEEKEIDNKKLKGN